MTLSSARGVLAIEGGTPSLPAGMHRPWPDIQAFDREAVAGVLERGELCGVHAVELTALQEEYAAYVGARHCLAVNTGTAAMHCALVAAGIGPGDEVIVPAFGYSATPMAVVHAGAVPVFVDIDPRTFNLDPALVEGLITERTAAIFAVHMHGLVADMDALEAIAARYRLVIVEDGAQAHGATYRGRCAGTFGTTAAFSINSAKNLAAGEGGLVVCDDDEAYAAARRLALLGEDTPRLGPGEERAFWSRSIGWNYSLPEMTAALARTQLRRLDSYNRVARRNAEILTAGLSELPGVKPPVVPEGQESAWFRYRFRLDPAAHGWDGDPVEFRDRLRFALSAEGVPATVWQFHPLPALPAFRRAHEESWSPRERSEPLSPWDPASFPRTSELLERSLVLGSNPDSLHAQDASLMERYVDAFAKVLDRIDVVLSAGYAGIRALPTIAPDEA